MLQKICPTDTVIPVLHCEIGTVNDNHNKRCFRQILSIESGSQEEISKHVRIMDIAEKIEVERKAWKQCKKALILTSIESVYSAGY